MVVCVYVLCSSVIIVDWINIARLVTEIDCCSCLDW